MAEPTEIDWPQQLQYLRELARIVRDEQLTRLEIESDGHKYTFKAVGVAVQTVTVSQGVAAPTPVPSAPAAPALVPLASPMVGVFYLAPSPGEPNFVEIGDRIERGQTIGLIEAMKVFNEITAEASGTLVETPVGNGQLVETGMPLMLLRP